MLRSLPSAMDDALDTLYGPNAVFSQFLGSASMYVFFFFFLSLLPLLVLSCLACLVFSLLPFLFRSRFLVFSFIFLLFFFNFFFLTDLRLSCVCVVMGTTCDLYVVVFLGWQAV